MKYLIKRKKDGKYFKDVGYGMTRFKEKAHVYEGRLPINACLDYHERKLSPGLMLVYVGK